MKGNCVYKFIRQEWEHWSTVLKQLAMQRALDQISDWLQVLGLHIVKEVG